MFPMRRLAIGLLITPLSLSLAACGVGSRIRSLFFDDSRGVVAVKIGDRSYSRADLDRFFDSRLSEFRDPADADKVKSNLLESFVEDRLLLQQAEAKKVEANPQLLKTMIGQMEQGLPGQAAEATDAKMNAALEKDLADSLKMQQYLHDYLLKDIAITDAECEAYYTAHIGEFIRNDVVHVREILVGEEAQAKKVLASLVKNRNRNFAELARQVSKSPSAAEGGDLGTFQRGELPEELERVVFALQPGNVSKIVGTKYGYHIFLVEEKVLAHQQRLWEVKDQIKERLQQERERELINKELATLAARYPVVIHAENLDFKFIGTRFPSR
jgi:parvulin-like peptidyl-prolyl isomerase